jgi:hypothetical protein
MPADDELDSEIEMFEEGADFVKQARLVSV